MSLLQKALRDIAKRKYSDHVSVRLSISSRTMEPESITDLLQLAPDYVVRKGETVYQDEIRKVDSNFSIWSLSSENKVSSTSFETHMAWILEQIFGRTPAVRSLQNDGCNLGFHVHIITQYPVVTPILDVNTLQFLAQLRIPIDFIVDYHSYKDD